MSIKTQLLLCRVSTGQNSHSAKAISPQVHLEVILKLSIIRHDALKIPTTIQRFQEALKRTLHFTMKIRGFHWNLEENYKMDLLGALFSRVFPRSRMVLNS